MAGEGNIEYGTIKQYKISSQAFFECNEGIFRVHMFIYPIDVENPENIGIYNICLVEKEVDFDMLKGCRETIKDDEMERHPIIWILDIAALGERTSNETTWYSDKYIYIHLNNFNFRYNLKNRLHKPQAAFVLPYPPHFSQTAISSSSPAEAVFGKTISSSAHSTG